MVTENNSPIYQRNSPSVSFRTEYRTRAIAGDNEVWKDIYSLALSFAIKISGQKDGAEDLSTEAVASLWPDKIKQYDSSQTFNTWLYAVIANKYRDQLKREIRKKNKSLDVKIESLEDKKTELPEKRIRSHQEREIVQKYLAILPEEWRTILEDMYGRGLTVNETSVGESKPPGTIKSQLFSALGFLRQSKGLRELTLSD